MREKYLAVSFDMDDTLLRTNPNYSKMCDVICKEMTAAGVPASLLDPKESSKHNLDAGMRYLRDNGHYNSEDIPENIKEKMKEIELEGCLDVRPYEGAERMLEYLKGKGYHIGVLTRGCREYAVRSLTAAGLIGELDALVCRDDHNESEAKPSPAAMEHLADKLGVRSVDILYIGDHKMDYFCARDSGAGFIGVLTRNDKGYWAAVDRSIVTIGTVTGLTELL